MEACILSQQLLNMQQQNQQSNQAPQQNLFNNLALGPIVVILGQDGQALGYAALSNQGLIPIGQLAICQSNPGSDSLQGSINHTNIMESSSQREAPVAQQQLQGFNFGTQPSLSAHSPTQLFSAAVNSQQQSISPQQIPTVSSTTNSPDLLQSSLLQRMLSLQGNLHGNILGNLQNFSLSVHHGNTEQELTHTPRRDTQQQLDKLSNSRGQGGHIGLGGQLQPSNNVGGGPGDQWTPTTPAKSEESKRMEDLGLDTTFQLPPNCSSMAAFSHSSRNLLKIMNEHANEVMIQDEREGNRDEENNCSEEDNGASSSKRKKEMEGDKTEVAKNETQRYHQERKLQRTEVRGLAESSTLPTSAHPEGGWECGHGSGETSSPSLLRGDQLVLPPMSEMEDDIWQVAVPLSEFGDQDGGGAMGGLFGDESAFEDDAFHSLLNSVGSGDIRETFDAFQQMAEVLEDRGNNGKEIEDSVGEKRKREDNPVEEKATTNLIKNSSKSQTDQAKAARTRRTQMKDSMKRVIKFLPLLRKQMAQSSEIPSECPNKMDTHALLKELADHAKRLVNDVTVLIVGAQRTYAEETLEPKKEIQEPVLPVPIEDSLEYERRKSAEEKAAARAKRSQIRKQRRLDGSIPIIIRRSRGKEKEKEKDMASKDSESTSSQDEKLEVQKCESKPLVATQCLSFYGLKIVRAPVAMRSLDDAEERFAALEAKLLKLGRCS